MKRKLSALFLLAFLLAAHMPAPGRADTESNIQTIYTYLTENAGLNRAAACGILSNIKSESNFNPEAIGDSGNDVSMLELTPNSFSVANAMPEAKRAARHLTVSNDQHVALRIARLLGI